MLRDNPKQLLVEGKGVEDAILLIDEEKWFYYDADMATEPPPEDLEEAQIFQEEDRHGQKSM